VDVHSEAKRLNLLHQQELNRELPVDGPTGCNPGHDRRRLSLM
jgi:hypothetical protein